jgi:Protein of unknown function (DUF2384)
MNVSPAEAVDTADSRARSQATLDTFLEITGRWGLSTDEQIIVLGSPARSTFFKWKKEGGALPRDTLERISHVFNIFKNLEILFPDPRIADDWVRKPNRAWGQRAAVERILDGSLSDLYEVRRYLDAKRG